ncbi:DUF2514 family protein [Pseudomonas taiwanensis]|uniref:DUF2514 family protein n=1 Tax=Pseudomonas taiwanensis TaxID=470150 RepID=UPI0006768E26|nr:DUF2514 family protein [Pseudomonas taiwanensis]
MEQLVRLVPAWCWWLAALLLAAAGQQYRVVAAQGETGTARGQLAEYRFEVAERDRRVAAQARAEELRRQSAADEEGESARKKLELAKGRAANAESAADGLRWEIARLRDGHRATCDTIAAQQRQAGTSAVVVLGGLLEESDRMAGDLATALERSRIAGLACEAVVDHMKAP